MDVPLSVRQLIIQHFLEHKSQCEIAKIVHLPRTTVQSIVYAYQQRGSVETNRRGRCGRKKTLSDQQERLLRRESLTTPYATARVLQSRIGGGIGQVSLRTVQRSLKRVGRQAYRPSKSPSLTPSQCRVRLDWARNHLDWTPQQWGKVGDSM